MKLKYTVDSLDGLDEKFHGLYTEKDGKFILTGVEGMKTQADVDAVRKSLEKERNEHKATKEKYRPFEGYVDDAETVIGKLDRFDELEAAAKGKLDDGKLNEMVEARLKTARAPLDRELKKLADANGLLAKENEQLKAGERRRLIHDAVREQAKKSGMVDSAVEDALYLAERVMDVDGEGNVVTKDGTGVTPGVDAAVWLTDMQPKRPHWWPESKGGGAKGSGGSQGFSNNPFTAESWNATEQGRLFRENPQRAEQMAKAAGTTVGGPKPAPRK